MFEWLSEQYLRLIANYKILLTNPTHCSTVDLLHLFTMTLLGFLAIKLILHLLIFTYLKQKYPRYQENSHSRLFKHYRKAAEKARMRRLPALIQFSNANPLIFTIGSIKPAIFIAPRVVEDLAGDELEAALIHELTHIKRFDNLLIWALEILFVAIPLLIIQLFALNFIFSVDNSAYALLGTLIGLIVFKFVIWKRILFLRELSCDDLSVDGIEEPLILASSLVNVWRISKDMPKYRWRIGLNFTQTLLPSAMSLDYRVSRLTNYKRPRFKFLLGKVVRLTTLALVIFIAVFLWQFYTNPSQAFAMYIEDGKSRFSYVSSGQIEEESIPTCMATADIDRCIKVMEQYAQSINTGDFSGIKLIFDKNLLELQTPQEMKKLYQILMENFGKIISVDPPRAISEHQAIFTTHFERNAVDIQIGLSDQGKIIEMRYLPSFNDRCQLATN